MARWRADRREALDTAEENAGVPKPDWLRMERRGALKLESGKETLDELGLGGWWWIDGARLDRGEANGSDAAVLGRVSVAELRAVTGRVVAEAEGSFSRMLVVLVSDMVW